MRVDTYTLIPASANLPILEHCSAIPGIHALTVSNMCRMTQPFELGFDKRKREGVCNLGAECASPDDLHLTTRACCSILSFLRFRCPVPVRTLSRLAPDQYSGMPKVQFR